MILLELAFGLNLDDARTMRLYSPLLSKPDNHHPLFLRCSGILQSFLNVCWSQQTSPGLISDDSSSSTIIQDLAGEVA